MIQKSTLEDREKVYRLWKNVFSFDDGGSIDHYFEHIFKEENCYVIKNKEGIISTLCYNKHSLFLHGKRIKASLICGVATNYNYRHQGYMDRLMREVIEELEHQELITLIQAYSPNLYLKYGFEMVYYRKKYHLFPHQVAKCSLKGIEMDFSDEELVGLYNKFMSLFDGYYIREADYYENLRHELYAESGRMITYRNEDGVLEGYMVYYIDEEEIRIEEIQYLNSYAFIKLLNYCFDLKEEITVYVSQNELVELMVENYTPEQVGYMMARINDYELFRQLYGENVENVKEAFDISGKPLFIRENW
jgi:hypothetical protein